MQIWKQYNRYYSVSENGEVKTSIFKNLRLLKGTVKPDGYKMYFLKQEEGKSKWRYAHRLVADLFLFNPDNLPEVNHKDLNKLNNHHSNLEYCTHAFNIQHSYKNGRKIYSGADHWNTGKIMPDSTRLLMSMKRKEYWDRWREKRREASAHQ